MNTARRHRAVVLCALAAAMTTVGVDGSPSTASAYAVPSLNALADATANSGTTVVIGARPASVPADYVVTPFGYFDTRCVHEVGVDQIVMPDGESDAIVTLAPDSAARAAIDASAVEVASPSPTEGVPGTAGSPIGAADLVSPAQVAAAPHVAACQYPRYSPEGELLSADRSVVSMTGDSSHLPVLASLAPITDDPATSLTNVPEPISNNGTWVEDARTSTLGNLSYISAQWTVPPDPIVKANQTIYYFPGLEDASVGDLILQPVLGWNSGVTGWSLASWNCCSVTGSVYHSSNLSVSAGSTVSGYADGSGCSTSTGVCSTWDIRTFYGTLASTRYTELTTTAVSATHGPEKMNWAFGGVLEAYSVNSCGQFPGESVTFTNVTLKDLYKNIKTPTWGSVLTAGLSPQCGYGAAIGSSNSVTMQLFVFGDVPPGNQFSADIAWMVKSGVGNGYPDGGFHPTDPVSRQAMAAFLYRLKGSPTYTPPVTSPFNDVPRSSEFYKEICWLASTGITTGYADGGFHPTDPVNRQAMAAFLYRYDGSPSYTPPTTSPFPDVATSDTFYKEISWLATTGITTGYADGGFHPTDPVTRQAMAAFLHRV